MIVDIAVANGGHDVYTSRPLRPECLNLYGAVIKALDNVCRGLASKQDIKLRTIEGRDCVYTEHGISGVCYKKLFPVSEDSVRRARDAMLQ